MKSILIIGLGRFGRHLCRKFMSLKNEVMIVDRDEAAVTALADEATSAQIADCTDENALRALGVKNFDLCFVCIGSDFASSLLITSMLKDMGAARVVAKASQDIHAKLLLRNGADDVVYPERDMAERLASRLLSERIQNLFELKGDIDIAEISLPDSFAGKTVLESEIRKKYKLNIIAISRGKDVITEIRPDEIFDREDKLIVIGKSENIRKFEAET